MSIEWEPKADDLFRRLHLQLDRRDRDAHEERAREAAEVHARAHGLGRVSPDAATVGFVKAGTTMTKTQVVNALRRLGIDPKKYDDWL